MKREKPAKRGDLWQRMRAQMHENKSTFFVYVVLRAFVLVALAASLLRGHYESVFYCLLTLVLFQLPMFVQANFGIELPSTLEIIILLFIFAAEILGELQSYYLRVTGWDTMDGAPVNVAIALLIPGAQAGTTHLKILSKVAEALMDEDFRATVKGSTDAAKIAKTINARLV